MPKKGKSKKGKKEKKPVRTETKYDDWELPRIEAQTAKYKDLLDKAAMDRNQVQMDKVRLAFRHETLCSLRHYLVHCRMLSSNFTISPGGNFGS